MLAFSFLHSLSKARFKRLLPLCVVVLLLNAFFTEALASDMAQAVSPVVNTNPTVLTPQTTVTAHGVEIGATNPNQQLHLTIALKIQDQVGLDKLLQDLHDPKSTSFGQYLTPQQFTNRFTSATARSQVDKFLKEAGLKLTDSGLGTQINADGPVSTVEQAFNVKVNDYRTTDGRKYYNNDRTLALPQEIADQIDSVEGLSNYAQLKSLQAVKANNNAQPATASCSSPQAYTPAQMASGYDLSPFYTNNMRGEGQTVALFELGVFDPANIQTFQSCYPDSSGVSIQARQVDSNLGSPANPYSQDEVELDMEIVLSLAPHLNKLLVYEAPNGTYSVSGQTYSTWSDEFQTIANDNLAQVVSVSYGLCENDFASSYAYPAYGSGKYLNGIFAQMNAQGQSIFVSSGDDGVLACNRNSQSSQYNQVTVSYPASDPNVTAVGGTSLKLNTNSTYNAETTWHSGAGTNNEGAGGGGYSAAFTRPSWQTGQGVNTNSNTRQVPDISSDSDPNTGSTIYITFCSQDSSGNPQCQTGWNSSGGTSAAAPLWAAWAALDNQYLNKGNYVLGFANPSLYKIFNSTNTYAPFHDIQDGSRNSFGGVTGYPATSGYDLATGIGSLDGWNLTRDLGLLASIQPPSNPSPTPVPANPSPTPAPPNPSPTPVPANPSPTPVPSNPSPTPVPANPSPTPVPNPGVSGYTYFLPLLANNGSFNGGTNFVSGITLQNVGNQPAKFIINYYAVNGTFLGTDTFNNQGIAANGSYTPGTTFIPNGSIGSAQIASTQPLAIAVVISGQLNGSVVSTGYTAINGNTDAKTGVVASLILNHTFGSFTTVLVIQNLGNTDTQATINYFDLNGGLPKSSQTVSIPKNSSVTVSSGDSGAGLALNFAGWASITSNNGQPLAAVDTEFNPDRAFFSSWDCIGSGSKKLFIPTIFQNGYTNFNTGLGLVNPNPAPANVTIAYYNSNGSPISTNHDSFTIPAYGQVFWYQGDTSSTGFPQFGGNFVGSAVVNSDQVLASTVNQAGVLNHQSLSGTFGTILAGSGQVAVPIIDRNAGSTRYSTGLQILNTSTVPTTFSIAFYNSTGQLITTEQITNPVTGGTVPYGGIVGFYQSGDTRLPDGFGGTAVITANTAGATFIAVTNLSDGQYFYTYAEPDY